MRARHRHFNARHAGADLVLDSRFINQADNSEVSSWADRSANAHTIQQTTAANRPTFKTNQMNGNPVVRFDGTNDFLNGGDILDILSNNLTIVCVAKRTSGTEGNLCGKSRLGDGVGRYSLLRDSGNAFYFFQDGSVRSVQISDTSTAARINTMAITRAATITMFFDGAQVAQGITVGTTSYNTTDEFFVGAYQSGAGTTPPTAGYYHNGDIAQIVVLFANRAPLNKRLHHAAAYSFKISCN
jgi:hypothetical protein